jgi:hypothetical protein
MRDVILHSTREIRKTSTRKQKNQEQRKLKKLAKRQEILEELEAKDFDKLKDPVKFGEVVDAPPVLTAIPKARGNAAKTQKPAKGTPRLATGKNDSRDKANESSEDENMREFKAINKRKRLSLAPVAKRVLDAEREKAVARYRAMKTKKITASGLVPLPTKTTSYNNVTM